MVDGAGGGRCWIILSHRLFVEERSLVKSEAFRRQKNTIQVHMGERKKRDETLMS